MAISLDKRSEIILKMEAILENYSRKIDQLESDCEYQINKRCSKLSNNPINKLPKPVGRPSTYLPESIAAPIRNKLLIFWNKTKDYRYYDLTNQLANNFPTIIHKAILKGINDRLINWFNDSDELDLTDIFRLIYPNQIDVNS